MAVRPHALQRGDRQAYREGTQIEALWGKLTGPVVLFESRYGHHDLIDARTVKRSTYDASHRASGARASRPGSGAPRESSEGEHLGKSLLHGGRS